MAEPGPRPSEQHDLVELFDVAWSRLWRRLRGLSDEEWAWCPTADLRIGLRWRLEHLRDLFAQERNWVWLGAPPPRLGRAPVGSAGAALLALQEAYLSWRDLITEPGLDPAAPVGPAAGPYRAATRRSFVLHVADELVHHAAEAALLRDLYEGSTGRRRDRS